MTRKRLLTTTIALALGLQAALLTAQEIDMQATVEAARPQVELADNGLFVEASAVTGLVTLNVRVINDAGELVFSTRTRGEAVQLLAASLPDGVYRYESVSVFLLTPAAGSEAAAQGENEGIARASGRFTVRDGAVVAPQSPTEDASLLGTLANGTLAALDWTLSLLVDTAVAVDLVASSAEPSLWFDDTDEGSNFDWYFLSNTDGGANGTFSLLDYNGTNASGVDVINISSPGTNILLNTWVVQSDGDMTWANGAMALDRGTQELTLGSTTEFPSDFNIYGVDPDIRLNDETDDSWFDIQYNGGFFALFADTTTTNIRSVLSIDVTAPANSLIIDGSGFVTLASGVSGPQVGASTGTAVDGVPVIFWTNDETNFIGYLTDTTFYQGVFFGNGSILSYSTLAPNYSLTIGETGNIGMGAQTAVEAVDVQRSAAAARFQLTSFTGVSSEAPQFIQRRARGTSAAPTAVQANDNLGLFSFRGYNGTTMGGSRAAITAQAAGAFSASSTPTRLIFSTTPVGSTAPQSVMVITPSGQVQVNGVNLNVPDYVFEDDYELMPLDELKSFIDRNGHLPGVAPAEEINTQGLDLAGSQMAMLEKVEELTLYTLQQHEQIKALSEENAGLRVRQAELQAQVERIDRIEVLVGQMVQQPAGEPVPTAATR